MFLLVLQQRIHCYHQAPYSTVQLVGISTHGLDEDPTETPFTQNIVESSIILGEQLETP
jgi:hypothetical protein